MSQKAEKKKQVLEPGNRKYGTCIYSRSDGSDEQVSRQ